MSDRSSAVERLKSELFDVLVIGGGVNGAVSAAALSARGYKVAIIDRNDFAAFTSQSSSNLVWGGIKYLENYEFFLVNKLCRSRNVLLESFPSMIKEIRFFVPIERGVKFKHSIPALMAGTWLYWSIGRGFTKTPRFLRKSTLSAEEKHIKQGQFAGGVEYSDAYLLEHDSRFVFNFVKSAASNGATAVNYIASMGSTRSVDNTWQTSFCDNETGEKGTISSKVVINAAGPYVDQVNGMNQVASSAKHVLSKGVHLIVKRIASGDRVLTFFDNQDRMFFVIPLGPVSMIGTTDTPVVREESKVTDEDRKYVLDNINSRLDLPTRLTVDDIISEKCGVRPLAVDKPEKSIPAYPPNYDQQDSSNSGKKWFSLSRKHILDIDSDNNYLSILGGKLTDCLNVGEEVVDVVEGLGFSAPSPYHKWYGEPSLNEQERFYAAADTLDLEQFAIGETFEPLKDRLWRRYGTHAFNLLDKISQDPAQGKSYISGAAYLACELDYERESEMITKLEDFVRRRTRLELILGREELKQMECLQDVCKILFPENHEQKWQEFIR
jgi:glycerol-3-phosphate dehydrogenase